MEVPGWEHNITGLRRVSVAGSLKLRLFPGGVSNSPSDHELLLNTCGKTGQCGTVLQFFDDSWLECFKLCLTKVHTIVASENQWQRETTQYANHRNVLYSACRLHYRPRSHQFFYLQLLSVRLVEQHRKRNWRMLFKSWYFRHNEHAQTLVWAMCQQNMHENLIPAWFNLSLSVSGLSRQHHTRCHVVEGSGVGRKFVSTATKVEGCWGMLDPNTKRLGNSPYDCDRFSSASTMGIAANSGFLKIRWKAGTDVCTCVGYWFVCVFAPIFWFPLVAVKRRGIKNIDKGTGKLKSMKCFCLLAKHSMSKRSLCIPASWGPVWGAGDSGPTSNKNTPCPAYGLPFAASHRCRAPVQGHFCIFWEFQESLWAWRVKSDP